MYWQRLTLNVIDIADWHYDYHCHLHWIALSLRLGLRISIAIDCGAILRLTLRLGLGSERCACGRNGLCSLVKKTRFHVYTHTHTHARTQSANLWQLLTWVTSQTETLTLLWQEKAVTLIGPIQCCSNRVSPFSFQPGIAAMLSHQQ